MKKSRETLRASSASIAWQSHLPAHLDRTARYWLRLPGSLTQHLGCLGAVTVQVLDERALQTMWCRDIALFVNQQICVTARSLVPLSASRGAWRAVRQLGTRPLADLLYQDPCVARSDFCWRNLRARETLYQYAQQLHGGHLPYQLWARRSIFQRKGVPLILVEAFLPSLWCP